MQTGLSRHTNRRGRPAGENLKALRVRGMGAGGLAAFDGLLLEPRGEGLLLPQPLHRRHRLLIPRHERPVQLEVRRPCTVTVGTV